MRKKILLIDDKPEEKFIYQAEKRELQEILIDLFSDKYEVLIEIDPDNGPLLVERDKDIEVVLLDLNFDGDPIGNEVAGKLEKANENAKVVVWTVESGRGMRIGLNQNENVWAYFVKNEIGEAGGAEKLKNIVTALIEDPYNEKWSLDIDDPEGKGERAYVNLFHEEYGKMKTIEIRSSDQLSLLDCCLDKPYECFHLDDFEKRSDGFQLGRVVSTLNARLLEAARYKTWGFVDSKRCPSNKVKIMLGGFNFEDTKNMPSSILAQFEEMKAELIEVKKRLEVLEGKV